MCEENIKYFKGTNLTVVEGMHQLIACLVVLFIILADLILGVTRATLEVNHMFSLAFLNLGA